MSFSDADLESYLDEALPAEEMVAIEKRAREDPALVGRLAEVQARRDSGRCRWARSGAATA